MSLNEFCTYQYFLSINRTKHSAIFKKFFEMDFLPVVLITLAWKAGLPAAYLHASLIH